jgi:hypothetical protein
MKSKVGLFILSIFAITMLLIYVVISQVISPRGSTPREIGDAWQRGELIRVKIEEWKSQNGQLPDKLDLVLPSPPDDVNYSKHGSENHYSINIKLNGRREFLSYFSGPDFRSQGWHHSGYGINRHGGITSVPYKP